MTFQQKLCKPERNDTFKMAKLFEDDVMDWKEDDIEKIQTKTGMYMSYVGEKGALHLCKEMKRIALEACKSEDEKAEVKDMTLEKLEDFGVLCRAGKSFTVTNAFQLMTDNKNRNAKIQCALFKGITRDIFID